jgi:hypothetical protein
VGAFRPHAAVTGAELPQAAISAHQVIVSLIAATTTTSGLLVRSRLDERVYPKGRRVSDAQLASVNLEPHPFHGEWNYTIHPTGTA